MVNSSNLARKNATDITVSGPPLKWCSVTLSEVISQGKRLEASVFDAEAKQARECIVHGRYSCVTLGGEKGLIDKAYYPGRFKRIYCEHGYGEAFFLPSQMTDICPKPEKFISRLTKCDMAELKLKPSTLLLTRSGTIGTVSLVSKTTEGTVFSDDVIRVTFKNPYDLGYVYAFLKTSPGSVVLQTNGYGSVITHLEPEHLTTIPIPNAPDEIKQKIHDLVIASYTLRDESNDLLDEAQALLIEELQLPAVCDFDVDYFSKQAPVDTFSVKLSDMAGRLDASYHVPIIGAITKHLREHAAEVTTVGDSRISKEVILPGRFKRIYVEEGYGRVFIGGKQLWELDPSNKKYLSLIHHGDRITKQLELHENMTLITCSGTIGKVALAGKHWENWAANQHIIRVVPANDDIAGYLNVFLSSEYGYQLIAHFTYGSVVDEIDDNHVRQIPFPLLKNKAVQDRINALALEANKKRYEAYLLEQQAIEIMNNEVIFAK